MGGGTWEAHYLLERELINGTTTSSRAGAEGPKPSSDVSRCSRITKKHKSQSLRAERELINGRITSRAHMYMEEGRGGVHGAFRVLVISNKQARISVLFRKRRPGVTSRIGFWKQAVSQIPFTAL